MKYNEITARLFFEVYESEDLELLRTSEDQTQDDLEDIFEKITERYQKETKQEDNKVFKLTKRIRGLEVKYVRIKHIIELLKVKKDADLVKIIRDYGYHLRDKTFKKDLEKIETNLNSLEIKISKIQADLEKILPEEDETEKLTFERSLMTMSVILEMGYIKSSDILLCDYVNLIYLTEEKVNALEKANK